MTPHPVDIPALLLRQVQQARRTYAIAWARSHAAQFPGIQFIAIVDDTMYAYEADDQGRIISR